MTEHSDTPRHPDEIRSDIRRTRHEMDETVNALEERLSPGRLFEQAWEGIRGGDGRGLGDVIRDHPVPLALMGLGLGWLAIESRRESSRPDADRISTRGRAAGRRGPYTGDASEGSDPDSSRDGEGARLNSAAASAAGGVRDAAASVKERGGDAAAATMEALSDAGDRVGSAVEDATDAVRDGWSEAAAFSRRSARRTRAGLEGMIEDHPMVLGAIVFGLGLAGGLSVPSSDAEDRLVGGTADTLKDEVSVLARAHSRKVAGVAREATNAALDEVDGTLSEVDGIPSSETIRDTAVAAGKAARATSERVRKEENLTTESVEEDVRHAAERVKREAQSGRSE